MRRIWVLLIFTTATFNKVTTQFTGNVQDTAQRSSKFPWTTNSNCIYDNSCNFPSPFLNNGGGGGLTSNPTFWELLQQMPNNFGNDMGNVLNNFGNTGWPSPSRNEGMPQRQSAPPSALFPFNFPVGNQVALNNRPGTPLKSQPKVAISQTSQPPRIGSGREHNTEYWKNWFKNRDKLENFVVDKDLENVTSSDAGYETEEYCIYDLRMHYLFGSPDGVRKRIIGFNGQFPGPTLYCTHGKTMIVRITNDIMDDDEPTSIHWHGIQQNLSPFYDGPQSITQCPLIRDTSMIYKFQLFQSGTYWYHSHHSYQYVDGAWGFLVIKNNPAECWQNAYDEERLISVNDWTHLPAKVLSEVYLTRGNFPFANSSLINGRGTFNCSTIERGQTCNPSKQGPAVITVMQGKRYRFRILNSSAAASYNFSIDGHKFVVIETDGVDTVKSRKVDTIDLLAAQRYSIIVIMDQPVKEYWIRIVGDPVVPPGNSGRAILRYVPNPDVGSRAQSLTGMEPSEPMSGVGQGRPDFQDIPWEDIVNAGGVNVPTREELKKYFPHSPPQINWDLQGKIEEENARIARQTPIPTTSGVDPARAILLDQNEVPPLQFGGTGSAPAGYDRLIYINMTECPLPGRPTRMCMNGAPFEAPSIFAPPVLYQVIKGIPVRDSARPIYTSGRNETIRVVINSEHPFLHPWHLHGHTFWVLGTGARRAGHFVPSRDNSKLIRNGVRRDTTITFANSWAVITYISDNPGVWFFHCHINWHLEAGLGMTFIEGERMARRVYRIPPRESTQTCARVGVRL